MYYSSASHYAFDEVPPLPGLLVERLSPVALVRHGSCDTRHRSIVSGGGYPIYLGLSEECNYKYVAKFVIMMY